MMIVITVMILLIILSVNSINENTISHYDICVLKENFNSYQVKFIRDLQNVKDAFLQKLQDIEQNLGGNIK